MSTLTILPVLFGNDATAGVSSAHELINVEDEAIPDCTVLYFEVLLTKSTNTVLSLSHPSIGSLEYAWQPCRSF
jgi:hypothetical protein